jgi:uncharacterized protein (DUF849 family)
VVALRESTDLIIQLSSGGAVTDPEADRLAVLDAGPEMASCTMGTVNFGDDVFLNRWEFIVDLHTRMQEKGIVPEYEIFDLGQLSTLERLLSTYGMPFGGTSTSISSWECPAACRAPAEALVACTRALRDLPAGTTFSATGIGRTTLPVMLASLAAGGHLRVGMEDTVTYAKGQPVESNAQLVARAAASPGLAQRPPMTCAEARALLGVPAAVVTTYQGGVALAEVVRSGFVEGRHHGSVAVLDASGRWSRRPATRTARCSRARPTSRCRRSRCCAPACRFRPGRSRARRGEPRRRTVHVERVRSLLHGHGLSEADLRCPARPAAVDRPGSAVPARRRWAQPVLMNCSGKHTGMLLTCLAAGWSIEDYTDPGTRCRRRAVTRSRTSPANGSARSGWTAAVLR